MLTGNMSAADVQHFEPPPNSWIISILNPNGFVPPINLGEEFGGYKGLLQVVFHDISEPQPGFRAISDEDASCIADFVDRAKEQDKNLYVHCTAGQCRSAAIVEVLLALGWEIDKNCHCPARKPNTLVYDKVRKACGLLHSWEAKP